MWAAVAWVAATPFASAVVSADRLTGSRDIVCAVMDVVGCLEDGGCVEGPAREFELPEFLVMDSSEKVFRSAYESGEKAVSPIRSMQKDGEHFIMQGVENGRGWDVAINTETGRMSASVVGDGVSFLAFGACTSL
jgi:hypothetical protein